MMISSFEGHGHRLALLVQHDDMMMTVVMMHSSGNEDHFFLCHRHWDLDNLLQLALKSALSLGFEFRSNYGACMTRTPPNRTGGDLKCPASDPLEIWIIAASSIATSVSTCAWTTPNNIMSARPNFAIELCSLNALHPYSMKEIAESLSKRNS